MASLLNTGVGALNAFQRVLKTTGHNIANANTEGFSRQETMLDTRRPERSGPGYLGTGVKASAERRHYDDFLADRARYYNASHGRFEIYSERTAMIDNLLADPDSGISTAAQDYFKAAQDVSTDPTSIPARQVLLNEAEQLAGRFRSLNGWMNDLNAQVTSDLETTSSEINQLATSIAEVNARLKETPPNSDPSNDLLDQRDLLIDQLSQLVSVNTVEQDNHAVNVFVGNGQALVVDGVASRLSVAPSPLDADKSSVYISSESGSGLDVTGLLSGGRLGGLLGFREEVLNPARDELGRIAVAVGEQSNALHAAGMDLDGNFGGDLFQVADPDDGVSTPGSSAALNLSYTDVSALQATEYRMRYATATGWTITPRSTGESQVLGPGGSFTVDGLQIDVTGAPTDGDSFILKPVRHAASAMAVVIQDPRAVAAAVPVTTTAPAGNAGTATISGGLMSNRTGSTALAAPVDLAYDATAVPPVFNISAGGTFVGSNSYDPGADNPKTFTVALAGLGDFEFTLTGTPADGDVFRLADNTGAAGGGVPAGVGDNRNAVALADLQSAHTMLGGTASFADAYGGLVADVATKARESEDSARVQAELGAQIEDARQSVSGVNLDEEAANLIKFQQAYQAAAQVISVANSLFDTILSATSGR